jgi:hypothetical protein
VIFAGFANICELRMFWEADEQTTGPEEFKVDTDAFKLGLGSKINWVVFC